MTWVKHIRTRGVLAVAAAGALAGGAAIAPAAHAAAIGKDTATPIFAAIPAGSSSGLTCTTLDCSFTAKTITTGANCSSEVIVASNLSPGLLYSNTACTESVHVDFSIVDRASGSGCLLDGIQGTDVNFNSGVAAEFSGPFTVSATFKPTGWSANAEQLRAWITSAVVSVHGTGTWGAANQNTGSTVGQFRVDIGPGLIPANFCALPFSTGQAVSVGVSPVTVMTISG